MKKYCFTKCFKKKMSDGAKNFLGGTLMLLIIIAILLVFVAVTYGIGYAGVYFGMQIPENGDYASLGIGMIIFTVASGFIIYGLFYIGRGMYRKSYKFAVARYEGEPYKCNIFEECKDEE